MSYIFESCLIHLFLLLIIRNIRTNPLTAISIKQPMIGSEHYQIYSDVETVVGGRASLPCHLRMPASSDSITLILWYRGEDISGQPIYSVDARNNRNNNMELESAKHFVSRQYSGRISFNMTADPALLTIDPIIDSDDGQYWCRKDFKWKRTTISVVSLNVIVPPKQVILKMKSYQNSQQIVLNNSVSLDEGSSLTLLCQSYGGKPLPIIYWYENDEPINKQLTHNYVKDNNTVQSELYLQYINSSRLNSVLKCQTSNDNQTFISSSITIHINLRPTSVMIVSINDNKTLLSGVRTTAICRSYGSQPVAVHSWFISSRPITQIDDTIISDAKVGKITQSVATFVPTPEDNGSHLICRAENTLLHNSGIEDRKILEVRFAPKVTLTQSGNGINGGTSYLIRGNDLRLHCNISANPSYNRLVWRHNSNQLYYDLEKGIVSVNTTLIVKNVSKEWIGLYQCVAYNTEGSGFSNLLEIHVFYPPKCLSPTQTIPANIGRTILLICDVDSNLSNVTFFWFSKHIDESEIKIVNKGLKSKLIINPKSKKDFGQYSCWAKNLAGNQVDPCLFDVYENKHKQQLICETNISLIRLRVECFKEQVSPQHDKQVLYSLKIYYDSTVLKNITSIEPIFDVNLNELYFENNSTTYQMIIYSSIDGIVVSDVDIMFNIPDHRSDTYNNSKRSVAVSHLNSVGDGYNNKHEFVCRVWIALTIAIACSVALIITIFIILKVCVIWKSVKKRKLQRRERIVSGLTKQSESRRHSISTVEHLVLSPDVIPSQSINTNDVSNDMCNRFIKDSLTYQNKNDISTRLEHNETRNQLQNKINRVTVLSDFHANVIDWDSIQVNDT